MVKSRTWDYPCRIEGFTDADTMLARFDKGMHEQRVETVRLVAIDAYDPRGRKAHPLGSAASAFAYEWLAGRDEGGGEWPFEATTYKDPDDFGRYLIVLRSVADGAVLNVDLFREGYAVSYLDKDGLLDG